MPCSTNSKLTVRPGSIAGLPFVNLALPVMDEQDLLPRLLACLSAQSYRRFRLFACVNQPESWHSDPLKKEACRHNAESLDLLRNWHEVETTVIDCSNRGAGWTGKKHGVGYARLTVMEEINKVAQPGELIISLDADTVFSKDFLLSVALTFSRHPSAVALAVPYHHRLVDDDTANRAILRYEIYMRHYFLNMYRIGSPYAFTALGSAMALPVWAYRAIGGMTPKKSGEDFYFLQKLKKFGGVLLWNDETVYPESRFSDRVFFGTGPAMIKGAAGDWSSYPVYPCSLFDDIFETYRLLPDLFHVQQKTKITDFMATVFNETDPCQPLRQNHHDCAHFTRAFHEKFDGLRILQYLKSSVGRHDSTDEENLHDFFQRFYPAHGTELPGIDWNNLSFADSPLWDLEAIRDFLFQKEMEARFTATLR